MDQVSIPDKVKRFIWLHVPSVPYLEAIVLIRGTPEKSWDSKEISQRLYLGDNTAKALLAELCAGGVLTFDEHTPARFRFQPNTEELAQMIDLLLPIYAKNLVGVTNLIHSKLNKKAQQFSDAFLWRKDK